MKLRSKKTTSKSKITLICGIILAVGLVAGTLFVLRDDKMSRTADKTDNYIDYSPATEEEKADSDRQKEVDAGRDDTVPSSNVTPVIVDASQYGDQIEVRSYVPGIIQDGGTCTIKITKGQSTITRQTASIGDATTTNCGTVNIPRTEFQSTGKWTVTISYTSPTHSGNSAETTLDIQ